MAITSDSHVVIVNRNYPPRTGVTGESACALAKWLQDNISPQKISIVSVRSNYAGGGSKSEPVGDVHLISSWYDGKNKLMRLFSAFVESFRLILKARSMRGSTTIVMTDPVFLSAWSSLLMGKRNWGLWSMDLFPEAFVAGNLVGKSNLLYRALHWLVYRRSPNYLVALGDLQAQHLMVGYQKSIPTAILPCGVYKSLTPVDVPKWKSENSGKIIIGYCGNLGEAHSVEFVLSVVRRLDPSKHHLLLTVYGVKAARFFELLGEIPEGVTIVDSVSREHLSCIDVHLVSLLGQWVNVCVPSKAVSAVCSGASFLFYGIQDCDNWQMLQQAGWIIEETDSQELDRQVKNRMEQITADELKVKKVHAAKISENLNDQVRSAFEEIAKIAG